jgi:hypothetical protein
MRGVEASDRLDQVERLLNDRGRRLGPVRVAAGRSGIAVAFPREPMVHVSWAALAAIVGLIAAVRVRRS